MGLGDKMMAIGDAWKVHQADPLKRKVAIGNGSYVDPTDNALLWGLDFVASRDDVARGLDVQWVISAPGNRPYIDYDAMVAALEARGQTIFKRKKLVHTLGHYIWKADYRPAPAPIRLTPEEVALSRRMAGEPFVAIEPYIKADAPPSKQWPVENFAAVVAKLRRLGVKVVQIGAPGSILLPGAVLAPTQSYRDALAVLKAARVYVGPEGGLHHGSAAMGTRAVVVFGGFISPQVTGYDSHVNLTGGAQDPCGTRLDMCPHCIEAFSRISVDEVVNHVLEQFVQGVGSRPQIGA